MTLSLRPLCGVQGGYKCTRCALHVVEDLDQRWTWASHNEEFFIYTEEEGDEKRPDGPCNEGGKVVRGHTTQREPNTRTGPVPSYSQGHDVAMQEGGPILDECKKVAQNEIMAQSHVNLVSGSGRAHTSAILGNMATQNQNGKLSTKEVADLTGRSETWIRKCRLAVENNGLGAFGSTSKSGHHKARMLCPTRLDHELGECTTKDCPLLHDCQCCKDGSQCSAAICKKWDTTKALRADKARVKRISKLSRKTCEDAEVVTTKIG